MYFKVDRNPSFLTDKLWTAQSDGKFAYFHVDNLNRNSNLENEHSRVVVDLPLLDGSNVWQRWGSTTQDTVQQRWPTHRSRSTGRSPSLSCRSRLISHLIDKILERNIFHSIFQKVHKNQKGCILWHFVLVNSLPTGRSRCYQEIF